MYKLLKKYLFMILTVTFMMNLGSAEAREANQINTISVRSRVEQAVQANTAVITVGIRVQDSKLQIAQDKANLVMQNLVQEMLTLGVSKSDMQTSDFNLNYNKEDKNSFRGYTLENNLVIKVRDIDKAGIVLDKALESGANQILGINFTYEGAEELKDQLLKLAIENGRKKADIVASADGRIAGRLLEVNIYTDSYQKAEMRVNKMMLDSSALGSQVLAGNVVISSEATLLFELN